MSRLGVCVCGHLWTQHDGTGCDGCMCVRFREPPNPLEADVARLTRERDEARAVLREYIEDFGGIHDDDECPEDDTCTCELVRRVNALFAEVRS